MKLSEIEGLRRLDAGATPGPWERYDDASEGDRPYVVAGEVGNVARCGYPWGRQSEDADLIVAARNALPRLLQEREMLLEALRAMVDCGTADAYQDAAWGAGVAALAKAES